MINVQFKNRSTCAGVSSHLSTDHYTTLDLFEFPFRSETQPTALFVGRRLKTLMLEYSCQNFHAGEFGRPVKVNHVCMERKGSRLYVRRLSRPPTRKDDFKTFWNGFKLHTHTDFQAAFFKRRYPRCRSFSAPNVLFSAKPSRRFVPNIDRHYCRVPRNGISCL